MTDPTFNRVCHGPARACRNVTYRKWAEKRIAALEGVVAGVRAATVHTTNPQGRLAEVERVLRAFDATEEAHRG